MGQRGRKRDYNGRVGKVIRMVQTHPTWTYVRIAGIFGVTRQSIHQVIKSEEQLRGVRLHNRQYRRPHIDQCPVCRMAIKKLRRDPAYCGAELFPKFSRERRQYHLVMLRQTGAFEGTIAFRSPKMLKAYRAWRDGATAFQVERRYGYLNWHSCLDKLAKPCPGVGRHEARDLRPTWQKDLEGHDIKRLTRFRIYGLARTKKGTKIPYQQTVHARSKRLAIENAGVTLYKMRGIKPISLRVKRWEKGDGNRGG